MSSFTLSDIPKSGSLPARFARLTAAVAGLDLVSLFPWVMGTIILVSQGRNKEVAVLSFTKALYASIFGFLYSVPSLIQLRCGFALARGDRVEFLRELTRIAASLFGFFFVALGVVYLTPFGLKFIGIEAKFVSEVDSLLWKICFFVGVNILSDLEVGVVVTAELSGGLGVLGLLMLPVYSGFLALFMFYWKMGLDGFVSALVLSKIVQIFAFLGYIFYHRRKFGQARPVGEENYALLAQDSNLLSHLREDPQPIDPGMWKTIKVVLFLGFGSAFESIAVELNYLVLATTNDEMAIYVYGLYMLAVNLIFFLVNGLTTASRAFLIESLTKKNTFEFRRRAKNFFYAGFAVISLTGLVLIGASHIFADMVSEKLAEQNLIKLSLLFGFFFNIADYSSVYANMILPVVGLEKELFIVHSVVFLPLILASSVVFLRVWRMGVVGAILSFILADMLTVLYCGWVLRKRIGPFLREVEDLPQDVSLGIEPEEAEREKLRERSRLE